jgi:hypothetical protein
VSAVNILFVSAMLADTNRRIPKIATFKYRLFLADTKDQFSRKKTVAPRSRRVGPRSGSAAIDVMPLWWRPWTPWLKPPAASRISEAARCRRSRPDYLRAVAAEVEAAHHQLDLRGRPLPPHAARDLTATASWPPWSKLQAACRISEAARCRHARPDRRRTVVTVVEAARRAMVAGARLGGGGMNAGPRSPSYSSLLSYQPP